MQRTMVFVFLLAASFLNPAVFTAVAADLTIHGGPTVPLPGLNSPASIVIDENGIAHIHARDERDLFFLQGYVHADDRIFQMDHNRRLASGTLAELLGSDALASDVQFRTIGLHRAAALSVEAMDKKTRAALDSYARGVNAWLAANQLPPEYGPLELSGTGRFHSDRQTGLFQPLLRRGYRSDCCLSEICRRRGRAWLRWLEALSGGSEPLRTI